MPSGGPEMVLSDGAPAPYPPRRMRGGRVGRGPRSHARNGRALLSPRRLLRRHRAQALEKLRFVDGLLEDGIGFTGSECCVAGDHDDPNTSIVQLTDQGIDAFAAAETEVDERNIRGLLADQMLGRGGRRGGATPRR